jgi:hypothetical protein
MKYALIAAALLVLAGLPGWSAQGGARSPAARGVPQVRPRAFPKGGPAARGPRLTNPASPAAWLYRATPEQRDRAIEKLRLGQQERIRENLAWFDGLPKEDQEIVVRRTERFAALSPEKRQAFAAQLQTLNRMPPPRRQAIRQALMRLQRTAAARRARALDAPELRGRFSPEEQKMILDLAEVMVPSEIPGGEK